MIGLDFIIDPLANLFNHESTKTILTVVGGILFIGSWFVPKKKSVESPKIKKFTVAAMIVLGLTTSIFEVATVVLLLSPVTLVLIGFSRIDVTGAFHV